jgi:hypothetical protein
MLNIISNMFNRILQYLTGLAIIGIFLTLVATVVYFYPVAMNYVMLECVDKYSLERCKEVLWPPK